MKIQNNQLSIYQLSIKNKNISILKKISGIAVIFLIMDLLVYSTIYGNFTFWYYGAVVRIFTIVVYIYSINTVYQYFKNMCYILIFITLPTILLAIYTYLNLFGWIWTLLLLFVYGICLRLLYLDVQKTDIDYVKSAKNLLEVYPEPLNLFDKHYGIVKKKKKISESNNILIFIFSYIPIQALFALPLVSATIAVAYLTKNGIGAGIMGMTLILSIIFIYVGFAASMETKIFHEAQRILDKKSNKK